MPRAPTAAGYAGKWPIRVNPDDVRYAYFQDPADERWHRLDWEHAAGLGTPFSGEAARYARRLAARPAAGPIPGRRWASCWPAGTGHGHRAAGTPDGGPAAAERAALRDPADGAAARSPGCRGGAGGRGYRPPKPRCTPSRTCTVTTEDPTEIFDDAPAVTSTPMTGGGISVLAFRARKAGAAGSTRAARERPEPLTRRAAETACKPARADYDEARHDWHANFGTIQTPQLAGMHDELEVIVAAGRLRPGPGARRGGDGRGARAWARPRREHFARDSTVARSTPLRAVTDDGHERLPVFRVGLTSGPRCGR